MLQKGKSLFRARNGLVMIGFFISILKLKAV